VSLDLSCIQTTHFTARLENIVAIIFKTRPLTL